MRKNRSLALLPADESAEATAEWLLVAGVCIVLAWAVNGAVTFIIQVLFARSAAIIVSPFG